MFEKEKPDPVFDRIPNPVFVRIPTPIGKKLFQVVDVKEDRVTVFDDRTGIPMVLANTELVDEVIDYCKNERIKIPVE